MKLLKTIALNLILGLNVFILFFLLFEERIVLPGFLHMLGRMHPLLLHFPIVLLLLALVAELFSKHLQPQHPFAANATAPTSGAVFAKSPSPAKGTAPAKGTTFLLYAGALSAAATVIFGLFLSKEDGYGGGLLNWHKWTGVAISFLAAILLWYQQRQAVQPVLLRAAMGLTCLVLLAAGHLGASLTHGDNFVLEPVLPDKTRQVNLASAVVFSDLVLPILEDKCFSCHNPDKAKGQLVLTDTASLLQGGKNGALFLAGEPEQSLLMERLLLEVTHEHHMPPKEQPQLSEEEIGLLSAWIRSGADFNTPLAVLPPTDTLHLLAKAIYGGTEEEGSFDFPAPDGALVKSLNSPYRVIAPLADGSPALDVSFFNGSFFKKEALAALEPLAGQVVYLNLSGMPLTDDDLAMLNGFTNLRQLNLNYTAIGDEGLANLGPLNHLQSLMLTGTAVTHAGIDSLLRFPGLRHLYVWNTAISDEQLARWTARRPGLIVETGYYDDGSMVLQLNKPELEPARAFFQEAFDLALSHPISGTTLRYTLDGSDPDSLTSPLFEKPFPLTGNTLVKVKAFKEGWRASETVQLQFHQAGFHPDSAALLLPPDPQFKARGAFSLFDRANGSLDHRDGQWLGYNQGEMTAELLFQQPLSLKEIAVSTLLNTRARFFPPAAIEVWGAANGEELRLLGKMRPPAPAGHEPVERRIYTCLTDSSAKVARLKIIVTPAAGTPAWHQAGGQPAWVFVDEILLN